MLLKNNAARLITINGDFDFSKGIRTAKYQIKPGDNPAVKVPDDLCETAFVKALLDDGALAQVAGPAGEYGGDDADSGVDYSNLSRSELVSLCENRDIEVIRQDTIKTLTVKLKEKDAEEKGANE